MAYREISLSGNISTAVMSGVLNAETGMSGDLKMAKSTDENDYENLQNKPSINGVDLIGNQSFDDLGFCELSALDVFNILNNVWKG